MTSKNEGLAQDQELQTGQLKSVSLTADLIIHHISSSHVQPLTIIVEHDVISDLKKPIRPPSTSVRSPAPSHLDDPHFLQLSTSIFIHSEYSVFSLERRFKTWWEAVLFADTTHSLNKFHSQAPPTVSIYSTICGNQIWRERSKHFACVRFQLKTFFFFSTALSCMIRMSFFKQCIASNVQPYKRVQGGGQWSETDETVAVNWFTGSSCSQELVVNHEACNSQYRTY